MRFKCILLSAICLGAAFLQAAPGAGAASSSAAASSSSPSANTTFLDDGTWLHVAVNKRGAKGKAAREAINALGVKIQAMDWNSRRLQQFVKLSSSREVTQVLRKKKLLLSGGFELTSSRLSTQSKIPNQIRYTTSPEKSDDRSTQGGRSPLRIAAFEGDLHGCRTLVNGDADIQELDDLGWTPLHAAAYGGHADVVTFLLMQGALVDAEDASGRTPLFLAIHNKHAKVVGLLLAAGANVNHQVHGGRTPLMLAASLECMEIIEILISKGAQLNAQREDGSTALMMAAASARADVVRVLLQAKANFRLQKNDGRTAYDLAKQSNHKAVLEVLGQDAAFRRWLRLRGCLLCSNNAPEFGMPSEGDVVVGQSTQSLLSLGSALSTQTSDPDHQQLRHLVMNGLRGNS